MGKNTNRAGRLFPRNRMEHWHKIVIWLVIYDCIAVNISYFAALWLRFDCRISMIPAYYLQAFRENENLLGSRWAEEQRLEDDKGGASDVKNAPRMTMRSFSREEMEQMAELARKYIDKVILRGVE